MNGVGFREAVAGDAAAIGAVHVAAWRETYAGLLPDRLLAGLSAEASAAMWRGVLDDPEIWDGTALFVAERGGEIVGFGACGEQRDAALRARGFDAEFGAVYVLRAEQRVGAGRALMRLMALRLRERGRTAAALWVLRENARARSFYERLGGGLAGEKADEQSGVAITELAYGWRDLGLLTGWAP